MKREIKFRQWIPRLNKYIGFWGFYKNEDDSFWNGPASESISIHEQFTGLKDKNGKEIYEGDILMCPYWWWGPGFVFLHQGECGPCKGDSVMNYLLGKDIDTPLNGATYNIWNGSEVEIIGNIYENPELLK